jgi:uncharacterized protein
MRIRGSIAVRLGLLCVAVAGCSRPAAAPAKPRVIRMSAANAQDPALRAAYSRLHDVSVQITAAGGASVTHLIELQQGTTDIAVALADVAYLAFTGTLDGTAGSFTHLRGMAMLDVNTFHFLVGRQTRITSIAGLKGQRVSIGPAGSSAALIAETLLKANGLSLKDVISQQAPYPETVDQLSRGDLDAAFMIQIVTSDMVSQAMRNGARLLDVDGPVIEELRQRRPLLMRTLIPKGTYPGQEKPIRTLGVDRLLICRADVDEDIVYAFLESYFGTPRAGMPPADLDRAPATPLPLHPGAARYYRQREVSR